MAGGKFFLLLDDIVSLLDDVALLAKVAAKKTAGVLGDDLALNAQQVSGVHVDRELPVVWAVAKGSLINKVILVPAAMLISAFMPSLIPILLVIGGLYLCYEGVEKLAHSYFQSKESKAVHHAKLVTAVNNEEVDLVAFEKDKVKGAIRTDFILSAEIIVIALGTLVGVSLMQQFIVLSLVAILMTIFVYGIVALIVRMDDAGLYLMSEKGESGVVRLKHLVGRLLVVSAPQLLKLLSALGMVAMFLVGGGIVAHNIPQIHHAVQDVEHVLIPAQAQFHGVLVMLYENIVNGLIGVLGGIVVLLAVSAISRLMGKSAH